LHWLVAALSHADRNATQTAEMLTEARKFRAVPRLRDRSLPSNPLAARTDKRADAKKLLDEIRANNLKITRFPRKINSRAKNDFV
jgi:hypothetical protein